MINSDKELLDLAVALREENRALKSLVRAVLNDVKQTVNIEMLPTKTAGRLSDQLWDCTISRETLLNLWEAGGDDVGPRETKRGTGSEEKRGAGKN